MIVVGRQTSQEQWNPQDPPSKGTKSVRNEEQPDTYTWGTNAGVVEFKGKACKEEAVREEGSEISRHLGKNQFGRGGGISWRNRRKASIESVFEVSCCNEEQRQKTVSVGAMGSSRSFFFFLFLFFLLKIGAISTCKYADRNELANIDN